MLLCLPARFRVNRKLAYHHPAIVAGTGALQASVVSFYSVVVILSRWMRVGCARLLYGHEDAPSWSGLRGAVTPAGPSLYPTLLLYHMCIDYV